MRKGEPFVVSGVADDDIFIDSLTIVLRDASGSVVVPVPWTPQRTDEILEERAPNPDGLGSQLVSRTFRTSFRASVVLPDVPELVRGAGLFILRRGR